MTDPKRSITRSVRALGLLRGRVAARCNAIQSRYYYFCIALKDWMLFDALLHGHNILGHPSYLRARDLFKTAWREGFSHPHASSRPFHEHPYVLDWEDSWHEYHDN